MHRVALGTFIVTMIIASSASPAVAAVNNTVGFSPSDYVYLPERVAVTVGDSVTWQNNDSVEPHNVRFEDGQFREPRSLDQTTFTTPPRTFSTEGVYRYFCEVHGRNVMNGVVYVNKTGTLPPDAQLRVSPNPVETGRAVTFDAQATRAGNDPTIVSYEWDLDGDGMFELSTGTKPTTSKTYFAAQNPNVQLKVTDSAGLSDVRVVPLSVVALPAPPPPAADSAPASAPVPTTPVPAAPLPPVTPSAGSTPRAFSFSFSAASAVSRAKGVAVKLTCSARCRTTATLSVSKSIARKARLGSKATTIGTARATLTNAGSKTLRVKLTPKARSRLARFKTVKATLKVAVTDAAGKITRKQKTVSLRR